MKKTYLSPSIEVLPLKIQSQILAGSLKTNVELGFEGGTPTDPDDLQDFIIR